ncbi:hypothetical protein SETIT_4G137200v2 [Setaria italica]|uniref:Ubiquitin-like protease family profile domain-containing protein n=1 Tax=Setaria italica TaxID=4555 RepID=A0A368QTW4_SETIT|nr:hypothetical protein SETIT_4G137200v2 [Setaria italica]
MTAVRGGRATLPVRAALFVNPAAVPPIDLHLRLQLGSPLPQSLDLQCDVDVRVALEVAVTMSARKTVVKILKDDHELGIGLIDNDMAIRFFFIIACSKLLFPSTDNNIRCKDVYLTRNLSRLPGFNLCKAVILYLDNLQCKDRIVHTRTPRAKYFDQNMIKKLISADRTKDQQGKSTFGLLPLRNSINTCYHVPQHPSTNVPAPIEPVSTHFPSISRKTQAMVALANFDAKAKKALSYMNIGQHMLQDAHEAVIHTLQTILNDEVHGNNTEEHHDQPHVSDAVEANDVDMNDGYNAQNVGSEHVLGGKNQELNQGVPEGFQQNRTEEQDLPPSEPLHDSIAYHNHQPWHLINTYLILHIQVHTDMTIDHIVPHVLPKVDSVATSPNGRIETMADDALGPILLQHCTQDDIIHRPAIAPRPQRLSKRPAKYVSPFKGDPQRAKAPQLIANAVRKKFHTDMKCKSDSFIRTGLREFTGSDISESFLDGEMLSTQFMSYFVACMSYDECHMADSGGYREYVNIEEDEDFSQWESHQALAWLLPVMEEGHYSIYCINFIHECIDVLDSSPDDHTDYHQQFTRFKHPIIDVCMHTDDNDCGGFFAIKFMELWNGDSFHFLFYSLYHRINEIKKLPTGLEAHRLRM